MLSVLCGSVVWSGRCPCLAAVPHKLSPVKPVKQGISVQGQDAFSGPFAKTTSSQHVLLLWQIHNIQGVQSCLELPLGRFTKRKCGLAGQGKSCTSSQEQMCSWFVNLKSLVSTVLGMEAVYTSQGEQKASQEIGSVMDTEHQYKVFPGQKWR